MSQWTNSLLTLLVGLFIGGFLKSYMSKKGENLATKEDIAELTRITKEIEHTVSTKAWARDVRKETAFEALGALAEMHSRLMGFIVMPDAADLSKANVRDALAQFQNSYDDVVRKSLLVSVVCGPTVDKNMAEIMERMMHIADDRMSGDKEASMKTCLSLTLELSQLARVIREDLGIEV
jgi:cytosine/adenosine deaminase-related metal-dependent hydrolase